VNRIKAKETTKTKREKKKIIVGKLLCNLSIIFAGKTSTGIAGMKHLLCYLFRVEYFAHHKDSLTEAIKLIRIYDILVVRVFK